MIVVFDTETERFRPAEMAPPIVCVQWLTLDRHENGFAFRDSPRLLNYWHARDWAHWALAQDLLVGHNIFYDLAVLCASFSELIPLVTKALHENRVTCTEIRQKLADIARGQYRGFFNGPAWVSRKYNLGDVSKRHAKRIGMPDAVADKLDPWRMNYGLLREVAVEQWHEQVFEVEGLRLAGPEALAYALLDPLATAAAFLGQETFYEPAFLIDQFAQCRKFWGLHLTSVWGLRTSARGVRYLEDGTKQRIEELQDLLIETGLVRPDGSRDTKIAIARMAAATGGEGRRTKTGKYSLDSEACASCGDHVLETYSEYASMKKVLSFDVKNWRAGIVYPIHTHFDVADTGRVTATKGVQNPRRLAGVRECIVPRGFVDEAPAAAFAEKTCA